MCATKALEASERLQITTLHSIGDAVISTDDKGCVVLMNPVAEKLTGWKLEDALGKEVSTIFKIREELTGADKEVNHASRRIDKRTSDF